MKNNLSILIICFLILRCGESRNESTDTKNSDDIFINQENKPEIQDSSTTYKNINLNSSEILDSLKVYKYPDLTAWGGLTLKSFQGELKIIEAIHNAELGFTKRIFYLNNNEIYKIQYEGHHAEWGKYEEKYPSDKYEWNPQKMTYIDTTIVFDYVNEVNINTELSEKLKQEGWQILEYIKNEKIGTAKGEM